MSMKGIVRKAEKTVLFCIKLGLFISLFLTFFLLFAIDNPQILLLSRTAGITMSTFVILGISMTAVYGGFAVGKKKSKDIIPSLSIAVLITDIVTYLQLSIMNINDQNQTHFTFRGIGILALTFIVQILFVYFFVYVGNYVFFRINPPERCIVICSDESKAQEILPKIERYKKQFRVTAVLTPQHKDLKECIRHSDSVFIYDVPADVKSMVIDYAYKHYTKIYLITELSDLVVNYAKPMMLDDLSVLCSSVKELTFEQKLIKRIIDMIASGLALLITSPIMIIVAVCIKLNDRGPVFFRQKRATLNGKVFHVLKFRTMIAEDPKEVYQLAKEKDDRITSVGKVLRKLRIDELPQFINILKGDMSIVGPRPEQSALAEMYAQGLPEFEYRLRAKAGLTGLAQIAGKYNTSPKDKLILDLMYIERYSLWLDVMLMFQTLSVFFKSDSTEGLDESQVVDFVKHQQGEQEKDSLKEGNER